MKRIKLVFAFILLGGHFIFAQNYYDWEDLAIIQNADTLSGAQIGGLLTPQYSAIDLNNDGLKDLLIFDRKGQVALSFINNGSPNQVDYTFAPAYMNRFPQGTRNFMLARDYNCDGIEDLFFFNQPSGSSGGVGVWQGSYDSEDTIQFSEVENLIYYTSGGGAFSQKIFIYNPDLPAVEDIDGDGDIDILAFTLDFIFSRNVFFYKNQSVEQGFSCDSLIFELEHECWGMFSESGYSNQVILSSGVDSCADNPYWRNGFTPRHTGSTLTAIDYNGDGSMDLMMGDVGAARMNMLTTNIVNDSFLVVREDTLYPSYDVPINQYSMPGSHFLDVDNDGLQDMLVSPNETALLETINDSVTWYYKNIQNTSVMNFELQEKDFLFKEMIDLGEGAYPEFFNVDGDSLLDLIVGKTLRYSSNEDIQRGLTYFKNVGTTKIPAFEWVTDDYAALDTLNAFDLLPTFGDIDGDSDLDMVLGEDNGSLIFVENIGGPNTNADWAVPIRNYMGISIGINSAPQLVDIDRDGDLDLMIGERNGNINFYENIGNPSSPLFSSIATSETIGMIDVNLQGSGRSIPKFVEIDGAFQLFLGHTAGGIIHMNNIENNILGTYDTLSMNFQGIYLGKHSAPALADLNGDDTLDFVLGNIRGGLNFYTSAYIAADTVADTTISMLFLPEKSWLTVFPNPSQGYIQVHLESSSADFISLEVYNTLGQLFTRKVYSGEDVLYTLDLSALPAGLYWLLANDGKRKENIPFVLKN